MTNRIEIAKAEVAYALQHLGRYPHKADRTEIVGSTYISGKETSDVDVLVLLKGESPLDLSFAGWLYGGSAPGVHQPDDLDKWGSWTRPVQGVQVNLIVVVDEAYFNAWLTAAEVCRYLHLKGYSVKTCDVHGVHEIIMDDSTAEDELPKRNY